jgi:transposase
MQSVADRPEAPSAIRNDLGAIFVSLELSRSTWLITSLSPGGGEKMSKHSVRGGEVAGLLERLAQLRQKAQARTGRNFPIIVIQEAGLDGFWIHRVLQNEGIESLVVDPASVATSRRRRRAKTDRIDGEALLRTLLAYKRGEPRVCAMVKAPTPEEEDRRRLCRERKVLTNERVQHVNRIKGLLFCQGVSGYKPLRRDRRRRLDELRTGDSRPLSKHLKDQISRELDRLELLLEQIKAAETERDGLLAAQQVVTPAPTAMLLDIKGIGPEFTAVLTWRNLSQGVKIRALAKLQRYGIGLSPIARPGRFLTRSTSHSVAAQSGCTKIPLAAGRAQEDETILWCGFSGQGQRRFAHLDPPGPIGSWKI